jgi:hypothetical protein
VPKIVADSGSWTQVQVSPGRTLPSLAVKVMSSGARGDTVVLLAVEWDAARGRIHEPTATSI